MSYLVIHRPARMAPPPVPQGAVELAPPPTPAAPPPGAASWLQYAFPVMGCGGALLFALTNPKPLLVLSSGLFAVGAVGMGVGMYVQQRSGRRNRTADDRRRYLAYLARVRDRLRATAQAQRVAAAWRHPAPEDLWTIAVCPERVWERRPGDGDFLDLRVGLGPRPLATPPTLQLDDGPMSDYEPVTVAAARRLLRRHGTVASQPLTVPLAEVGVLSVVGERGVARALARALLCQAVTFHPPEDLRVALCYPPEAGHQWEWVKWLPHARHPRAGDGPDPARMIWPDPEELATQLRPELEARRLSSRSGQGPASPGGPHLLVVVDPPAGPTQEQALSLRALTAGPAGLGTTVLVLADSQRDEPPRVDLRARVGAAGLRLEPAAADPADPAVAAGRPDLAGPQLSQALARRLAPLRLSPDESPDQVLTGSLGLPELLGVGEVAELDPWASWRPRPAREFLRVPIGVNALGKPLLLDLKESALGGMGPHGLVVGATGSGKSELLRTLVIALAITHPPDQLAFVLVDFKGGATFAGMAGLPHVAGTITNLQDDLAMVDRMHAALFGEQRRRQELLRAAGNLASIRDYHQLAADGEELEPLPFLLVIVDEFSELLASRPEFIELFVAIGRLGRSLGMHLLFASQRLDEGRLRGLESHLSYRIGLRTFSAAESRAVLGVPDAHELPAIPGSAYLKVDPAVFERFKAAMVSGPYRRRDEGEDRPRPAPAASFPAQRRSGGQTAATFAEHPDGEGRSPSVMDVAVARLAPAAPRVHQVWLPPLAPAIPLDRLLPVVEPGEAGGLLAPGWSPAARLRVPLGVLDRPQDQLQVPLVADFAGATGHLAVVGSPQSGKSTLLRTLVASFVLSHRPQEVQFYCVDLGGGTLQAVAGAPHVASVTGRHDPERVRRVIGTVQALLDDREQLFLAKGIDSVQTFRALRDRGQLGGDDLGDVFLVLDNWAAIRQEFEDLEPVVVDLAARGLGYGIHLVVAANRWLDIRPNLRDSIGGRVELRLADPLDSEIGRKEAANVPVGVPGRGLGLDRLHFQTALPRIDGQAGAAGLQEALEDLVGRVKAAWRGATVRPVHVLPASLRYDELPPPGEDARPGVPLGVAETDLAPVYLDLCGADPHLVVFGDGGSGKTTLLRSFIRGLTARLPPAKAKLLVVDYRRTLLEAVDDDHLAGYAGAAPAATEMLAELHEVLQRRLPGADLTVDQLRSRSWWTGPEVYVVVDDYDLVASPSGNPLLALLDLLAQGRDVGVHLVLARRVGGAARALYEPVLQRVKELGSPGIILSGDPEEGPLLGPYRAMPRVPGRGLLVRRQHRSVLLQAPWLPPGP
jgi:DNA segregation ATPase FtsK/SpoIIIE, S-DNA-T family